MMAPSASSRVSARTGAWGRPRAPVFAWMPPPEAGWIDGPFRRCCAWRVSDGSKTDPHTKTAAPVETAAWRTPTAAWQSAAKEWRVGTDKPNSVCSNGGPQPPSGGEHHLSGTTVAGRLVRPTCVAGLDGPPGSGVRRSGSGATRFGLARRGVCLAAFVAEGAGALLPHPFTPYRSASRWREAASGGTALCCTCRHPKRQAALRTPSG